MSTSNKKGKKSGKFNFITADELAAFEKKNKEKDVLADIISEEVKLSEDAKLEEIKVKEDRIRELEIAFEKAKAEKESVPENKSEDIVAEEEITVDEVVEEPPIIDDVKQDDVKIEEAKADDVVEEPPIIDVAKQDDIKTAEEELVEDTPILDDTENLESAIPEIDDMPEEETAIVEIVNNEEDAINIEEADDKLKIDDIKEEEKKETPPVDNKKTLEKNFKTKVHFSFEARIIVMVGMILILFLAACYLILNALNYYKTIKVNYDEYSNVHYQVCLNQNDYYGADCLDEGMEYVSDITDFINTNFTYNVDFSRDINYKLGYHVVAITKIFDKDNTDKVLYKNEEVLVEKTDISKNDNNVFLNTVVKIDFGRYNATVLDYQSRYSLNSSANVEVILYLDEESETRKVASMVVPLGEKTYSIKRDVITNLNRVVVIKEDSWNDSNTICAVIASLLILICIWLIIRVTRLVLLVVNSKSKYEQRLNQILREYDRLIVIARNGYESTEEKKVIKVDSFEELLDAREALQKPIIYSKINDVKSEFIVEDDDKLFIYILKEADL